MKKEKMIPNALALALLVALSVVPVAASLESADRIGETVEVNDASSSTLPDISEAYPAGFLSGIKVAYANIHGERQTTSLDAMKDLLRQLGATVTTITSVNQVSNYNILWVDEGGTNYTSSEITTIQNWLAQGSSSNPRGILFHGDQVGSINLMNAVGAFYTGRSAHAGVSTNIRPPVNTIVKNANFPAPMNSISNMNWLAKDTNNDHVMVAINTAKGRAGLIAEDLLWYSSSEPNLGLADNSKLGVITFGWLGWKVG